MRKEKEQNERRELLSKMREIIILRSLASPDSIRTTRRLIEIVGLVEAVRTLGLRELIKSSLMIRIRKPNKEKREIISKIMRIFESYPGIMQGILDFLSTKPRMEGDKRVVYPARRVALLEGKKGSVEIKWPIGDFPRLEANIEGVRGRTSRLLCEYKDEELRKIEDFFKDESINIWYAGPGDVLDFEELIGSIEERKINKHIEKILSKRTRNFDIGNALGKLLQREEEQDVKEREKEIQRKQILENYPTLRNIVEKLKKNLEEYGKNKWVLVIESEVIPFSSEKVWLGIAGMRVFTMRGTYTNIYIGTSLVKGLEKEKEITELTERELRTIEVFLEQGAKTVQYNSPI